MNGKENLILGAFAATGSYFHEQPTKWKSMNNNFDELAKRLAQSTARRQALKKFGLTLAGMAVACFGLCDHAKAQKTQACIPSGHTCDPADPGQCCSGYCDGTLKGSGGKVGPPWKCA